MTKTNENPIDLINYIDNVLVENSQYRDLIFEFVTQHKLENQFHSFLIENMDKKNLSFLDLEHMVMDYR